MTYDPTMRLLTVLNLLHLRGELSAAELGRRLEVSPRTVQRYVARLQDMGFPVTSTRGRGAAYRLHTAELPPLALCAEEALALGAGLGALNMLGLGALAPAAASARAKLERVLPSEVGQQLAALERHVGVGSGDWTVQLGGSVWAALIEALGTGRVLETVYCKTDGPETCRKLQPYGTAFYEERWYLVGWCLLRGELRCFRVDRIAAAAVTPETFEPPAGFDALAYLQATLPHLPAPFEVSVWLSLPPAEVRQASELGWRTELSPEGDGTRLRCQRSGRHDLCLLAASLLTLDAEIRLDSPLELQEEIAAAAQRAAKLAACPPPKLP
ncbi:helix-turn-helix transcriptional regulator [Deinococcus sp. Marseille-Q6407]|uniref:helix-turn-helix transcriptional regulator n=1 Tax=Deinococcus sp. Marseille-Q6407 TaxID=2969223 RepID=UPI0021C146F9|nr:WYL domain-containing protein [Deinococcus sp. Marseille-Q6407]